MADPAAPDPARRLDPTALQRQLTRVVREGAATPAWLLGEIGRRMDERLGWIRREPAEALVWWPELGGGEALLRQRYPAVRLQAQAAPGAGPRTGSPWWKKAWARGRDSTPFDPATPATVGLVWANMMLHWAADLPTQLATWQRALEVDGFLMFSSFGPDTAQALQALHDALGWGPAAAPFVDMHDLGDLLVQGGFADPVMDMEFITLSWADLPAMLAELRGLGGNVAADRAATLRTPRAQARWQAEAERRLRGPDGRLQLRFEIVYGHAFKPAPRARMQPETTVSLDALRTMVRQGRTPNPD